MYTVGLLVIMGGGIQIQVFVKIELRIRQGKTTLLDKLVIAFESY